MQPVIDRLTAAVRDAAVFNQEVQVAPACVLWPDRDRQWEAVIPRLQTLLAELLILGDYAPEKRTGPAIWLRCVIAGKGDFALPPDHPPILYLPGFSRQDLRAVESCPDPLKLLAELQYRGVIWSQENAKDWTVLAFLKSNHGGLSLDIAQDNDAKNAMQLALYRLLDEDINLLKDKYLDKDYFNTLLAGGDPVRDLLQWLDQGDVFRSARDNNAWKGFVGVTKSQLAFDPDNDGILVGAAKLAVHEGPWKAVWERFCEAPKRYPNIPSLIRKCTPPNGTWLWTAGEGNFEGWPQWNEDQENILRGELKLLTNAAPGDARKRLLDLEKGHGVRRRSVWAELDEAPLAQALEHLKRLAETTSNNLAAGTVDDLEHGYIHSGWYGDDALIRSLECVDKHDDMLAVTAAIRAVYLPWAEESAKYLQKIVDESSYPGGTIVSSSTPKYRDGECLLFVDGLRYEAGVRLATMLSAQGVKVEQRTVWSALPSVTATAKPAITPVKKEIRGQDANSDFEPCVAETGQSLKGGYHLKKLLGERGWPILGKYETGDGHGNAWAEFGDIDGEGHDRGWKLAQHLDAILCEICDRVLALLSAGWKSVRIVTDHGWLLLPGGLPTVSLPSVLTDNEWGRCAALKPGATSTNRLFSWYWNPTQHFALADGISCYRAGKEYAHGGLSLQECLTLELNVTAVASQEASESARITQVNWKGLRCAVTVEGNFTGLILDIRRQPGNASSSVVASKPLKPDGTASVVVPDEDFAGVDATIVLVRATGELVAQQATIIGGGME